MSQNSDLHELGRIYRTIHTNRGDVVTQRDVVFILGSLCHVLDIPLQNHEQVWLFFSDPVEDLTISQIDGWVWDLWSHCGLDLSRVLW